jgi:hypothetical protein
MLEVSKKAAIKFAIDTKLIEERTDTQKNLDVLGNDLTSNVLRTNAFKTFQCDATIIKLPEGKFVWN